MRWLFALCLLVVVFAVADASGGGGPEGKRPAPSYRLTLQPEPKVALEKPFWKRCVTGYRCARAVVPRYFPDNWRYVLSIIDCETGGTFSMSVVGSAGEISWYQLHPVHFGWVNERRAARDPRYASAVARRLSDGGTDFSPWTCA